MSHLSLASGAGARDRAGARARRVLLAIDFGATSIAAARWVARHVAPDAELLLVHVVPIPRAPAFLVRALRRPDALLGAVTDPLRVVLDGLAAELGSARTRVAIRAGDPAEQLAAAAAELGADLVVVGAPRRRARAAGIGRNTVDRLLRRANVPLLQAAAACDAPPDTVLAAADGGARSDHVLRAAWSLAARLEARLVALHVIDEDVRAYARAMAVAAGAPADAPAAEQALWDATARWLGVALETSGAHAHRAHVLVGRGDPGREIVTACDRSHADIVVVGRSGLDAAAPAVVGATARYVLRDAGCAVLVVPDARGDHPPHDDRTRRREPGTPALTPPATSLRHAAPGAALQPSGDDVPPAAQRTSA